MADGEAAMQKGSMEAGPQFGVYELVGGLGSKKHEPCRFCRGHADRCGYLGTATGVEVTALRSRLGVHQRERLRGLRSKDRR